MCSGASLKIINGFFFRKIEEQKSIAANCVTEIHNLAARHSPENNRVFGSPVKTALMPHSSGLFPWSLSDSFSQV
jgi:hypothetical protein